MNTYFDPRLRLLRCPGINLAPWDTALWRRKEPHDCLAGDRFRDAIADVSTDEIFDGIGSFETFVWVELIGGGSSFRDNLKINSY